MSDSDTVIHVGDVGTIFRVTIVKSDGVTVVPVNTATKKEILFQKGDGTRVAKTATFYTNGTDGIIQYAAIAADISVAGTWYLQGYVEMGGGKYYSEILPFSVKENLTAAS
jgi:hypothetical protein